MMPQVANASHRLVVEQGMDYVLLSPEEAATLLSLGPDQIVRMVESGELGGLRVAGHWRIPLKSITQLLATGMQAQTVRGLERVFEDHATWQRVFGAHPEVTQSIEAGAFPQGSVGAYLKEAISVSRGQRAARAAGEQGDPSQQDDEYEDATRQREG
jgi:excisionase family DNA binding protein